MRPLTALAASLALTATGLWLLRIPAHPATTSRATAITAPTTTVAPTAVVKAASPPPSLVVSSPTNSTIPVSRTAAASAPAAAGATAEAGALAPADGPAGDPAVQAMLDRSTPNNLPVILEQQLAQLGRHVWLADVTGAGRTRWPVYFPGPGSSGYTHVRVQAAIARRTGTTTVTVTLLWAGTSPAAEPQIGLPGTVKLARHADGTWEPTR